MVGQLRRKPVPVQKATESSIMERGQFAPLQGPVSSKSVGGILVLEANLPSAVVEHGAFVGCVPVANCDGLRAIWI